MKNIFTIALVILLPLYAFSQKNFYHYTVGIGGGLSRNAGDLQSSGARSLFTGNIDYFFSPYIHSGLEFQSGSMLGESNSVNYLNKFKSLLFLTRLHAGQLMRLRSAPVGTKAILLNTIKGFYAGTGVGAMFSKQTGFSRINNETFKIASQSMDAVIPLTVGLDNSGFNSRFITGIAYQGHFGLSDQLDGYESIGSRKDYYSSLIVSIRYRLGPLGIY